MNWDKPLSEDKAGWAQTLNEHHGLNLTRGDEWRDLVGAGNNDKFYPKCVTYCKLRSSPLFQALE
jgi:alkyl hydroperoxide reductase subunit AhpF